jgi:Uma2 family endonuclease
MTGATRPRYTLAQYVQIEEYANLKHEYFDGQVFAMAGGTPEHARIASLVGAALVAQLRGKPCAGYSSDARVRVAATGLDTYPDISVVCGGEERDREDALALANPVVLVEVTSDSSEAYDRGEKFEHYQRIPSLREYVLVSHRQKCLEVFRRGADGLFPRVAEVVGSGRIELSSIDGTLDVEDVYRDPFGRR